MNIPTTAMDAAKVAMETVTPPPGVDRTAWLDRYGPYALLAGAIAAAAPYIAEQAWQEGRSTGQMDSYGLYPTANPYRKDAK
jgi:hypothetical protein